MDKNTTKKRLVAVTSEIIRKEGIEGVSARKIASAAGCTATVIYKYFDNLDYLITMACFPFLDIYHERDSLLHNKDSRPNIRDVDSLTANKMSWRIFIQCAFEYPEIYERLFWGVGKLVYEDAISEYYELFPENLQLKTVAAFTITTFSSDLESRDMVWLRRAASEHSIQFDDIFYISKIDCCIVHGMLSEYLRGEVDKETAIKTTVELVEKNMDTFAALRALQNPI